MAFCFIRVLPNVSIMLWEDNVQHFVSLTLEVWSHLLILLSYLSRSQANFMADKGHFLSSSPSNHQLLSTEIYSEYSRGLKIDKKMFTKIQKIFKMLYRSY
jgi:hypothetical protein